MKLLLPISLTFLLVISALLSSSYFLQNKSTFKPVAAYSTTSRSKYDFRLKEKAGSLEYFAMQHSYNDEVCFLLDMNLSSGKNRFFVYDLNSDSVLLRGLVAHGSCDAGFQVNPTFSNTINSGCSSLGRYKLGNSYKGNFGLAYKLHGLDSLNNNAFHRNIVLHSYDCVPEQETDPELICNSRGCPMVSPGFLSQLKTFIGKSKKPIL